MCAYAAYAYPSWDQACKGYMQIGATLAYSNITVKVTSEAARHICPYGLESMAYPLYTLHTDVTTVRKDHMPTGEILAY